MAKTNTAELGFEKQIWKAADLLRGNMDASEYKSVVLGLISLNIYQTVSKQNIKLLSMKEKALRKTKMNIPMSIFSLFPKRLVGRS